MNCYEMVNFVEIQCIECDSVRFDSEEGGLRSVKPIDKEKVI